MDQSSSPVPVADAGFSDSLGDTGGQRSEGSIPDSSKAKIRTTVPREVHPGLEDMESRDAGGLGVEGEPTSNEEKARLLTDEAERITRSLVTVVVPTLNEGEAIGALIEEIRSFGFDTIIVADGYSRDDTREVAEKAGAEVIMQHGSGKAGALLASFQTASTPYLVVMDGDGSYDPADLDKFARLSGSYDFVKGVRASNSNMTPLHKFGNRIITRTFDVLFGTSVGDVCSGMYMLRTDLVRSLHLEKHPMTVEQEIAAEMIQSSAPTTTVPINYRKRAGGTSKTKTWRQGLRDMLTNFDLARTYNPVFLFSALSALALIPAVGVLAYALALYVFDGLYREGLFIGGVILLVLGAQGFTVSTIGAMLKRIERKLTVAQRRPPEGGNS